jgi:hypothetical protein
MRFPDIPEGHYSEKAVDELSKRGIYRGHNDGSFGFGESLKRQDHAVVLWRLIEAGYLNDVFEPEPEEPPPSGWGDGVPFGSRPRRVTPLRYNGASDIVIENLDFRGDAFQYGFDGSNDHVCVLLENCRNVTVRNCDFTGVSEPVAVIGGGPVVVEYNRCDGITGPSSRHGAQTGNFIQTVGAPVGVTVRFNRIKGGDTEDIISSFSAIDMHIHGNEIDGTGWTSGSGTGIIVGDGGGSGIVVEDNRLLNPGQVGIAVAGGVNGIVRNNIVYSDHPNQNVGMYHSNYYPDQPFGNNTFQDNRVRFTNDNGFWGGSPGFTESGNVWNDFTINPAGLAVNF